MDPQENGKGLTYCVLNIKNRAGFVNFATEIKTHLMKLKYWLNGLLIVIFIWSCKEAAPEAEVKVDEAVSF